MKNAGKKIGIPSVENIKIQEKTFWNMNVEPGELQLSRVSTDLVLSEPNALNPIRRLNERKFEKETVTERSFYKSRIVGALEGLGYDRVLVRNCHFIPSFMPTVLLSLLQRFESFLERAPLIKEFSGSINIFAYRTCSNPNAIHFRRPE